MPTTTPEVELRAPRFITDIDQLMRRSDKKTPKSSESLFKAAITGMERSFRKPEAPAPNLHLWTATGYRFFQDAEVGLASHVMSLPDLWGQTLPVLVADTRASRLAHGGVVYVPASMYRDDPDNEYGCYFASVVALDGHGFFRRADCPVTPDGGRFRRAADWRVTDPSLSDYEAALGNPQPVIDALIKQERPVQVPGLIEVANS